MMDAKIRAGLQTLADELREAAESAKKARYFGVARSYGAFAFDAQALVDAESEDVVLEWKNVARHSKDLSDEGNSCEHVFKDPCVLASVVIDPDDDEFTLWVVTRLRNRKEMSVRIDERRFTTIEEAKQAAQDWLNEQIALLCGKAIELAALPDKDG